MKISYPNLTNVFMKIILIVLCVYAGWYLKGRLSPSAMGQHRGGGEVYILAQKAQTKDVTSFNNKISYIEAN